MEVAEAINSRYARYAVSLNSVREKLDQLEGPVSSPPIQVLKQSTEAIVLRPKRSFNEPLSAFFGDRTDSTAGFLHLMLTAAETDEQKNPGRSAPRNQLCLMRSKAELVVYYDSVADTDLGGLQWTGVFKPTPECDFHFASSEPPTHDTWTPNTADTEISAYVVRRTLDAIKRKTREFLEAERVAQQTSQRSVRDVANALRSFVPHGQFAPEPAQPFEPERHSRRSRRTESQRPEVVVHGHTPTPDGPGFTVQFELMSEGEPELVVTAQPFARTADGRMALESDEYQLEWKGYERSAAQSDAAVFKGGSAGELKVITRTSLALDLTIDVEEQP